MKRGFAPWTNPNSLPLLRFDGVTKRFGDVAAVDGLTLDIYEHEFFALLGPSGCGKTTLLRLVAGFETPDEGRILLSGEDIGSVPPYQRPVNMMFQSYALFPHMTVAGNVAFGLRQDGLTRQQIETRVAEMLALVKLEPLAGRKPHQLSGGQRQRVALARSLAKRPKMLLLDEPLAALDRKLREETQVELMDLQSRLGTSFLIVTHDQEEAMTMAHRIGVINHGRLVQAATPTEIYEQPISRWVAQFIGDVNMFEGAVTVVDGDGVEVECAPGRRLRAILGPGVDASPGSRVSIALRPERVRIATAPPAENENGVFGRVWDISYFGGLSVYKVKLDDGSIIKASLANTARTIESHIDWNDQVWLSWSADAGIVLPN